ncbi:hypothetical protein [Nostoc sp.]|uniref:hypothetical protein n=1 Tax=Nostoc sp. TaxID=1180 RepID=UPI002FFCF95F
MRLNGKLRVHRSQRRAGCRPHKMGEWNRASGTLTRTQLHRQSRPLRTKEKAIATSTKVLCCLMQVL